jgi:hypothetical protein
MERTYEVEGVLEGDRVIRLRAPLPCGEGPVRVSVTPLGRPGAIPLSNRRALAALDHPLSAPDDLSPEQWEELERVIREHPFKVGTPEGK